MPLLFSLPLPLALRARHPYKGPSLKADSFARTMLLVGPITAFSVALACVLWLLCSELAVMQDGTRADVSRVCFRLDRPVVREEGGPGKRIGVHVRVSPDAVKTKVLTDHLSPSIVRQKLESYVRNLKLVHWEKTWRPSERWCSTCSTNNPSTISVRTPIIKT